MSQPSQAFANLFQPLQIGGITIRNRILSTGHDTTLPTDGTVNEALIAYHEARARGGVGLIVGQVVGVHDSARYTSHLLMGTDDACIPGFARLVDVLHSHGTKFFAQLFHPGREIMQTSDGTEPVAYAPSMVPNERFHVMPRAMSRAMIDEVVQGYGATARRLHKAGVDGAEIVASHGYLPAQFLNPNVNRRKDEYGGTAENRLRFLSQVIAAVRKATGPEFVIGLRISGDEKEPNGLTEDLVLEAITALAGGLDYVNVIAGSSASLEGAIHIVPPMFIDPGYVAPFAASVKRAVDIPVLVAGRINQPQVADRIIATGQADMCGMTRALICDPEMPLKAQAGRPDDIRACIGCNQACIGHFQKGVAISCIQHPETGRELQFAVPPVVETARKLAVIGGGPGGMKAASVAAMRGHAVTLYEAEAQLGGQARLAQLLPGRAEFGGIITNLEHEMQLAGVTVRLNTRADLALLEAEAPDAVIVATGGTAYWPDGIGTKDGAQVVDAWQVLRNQVNVGGSVVIADWRCDWVGLGLAEMLAQSGRRVRLAVNGTHAGEMLQTYVRDAMVARVHKLGVEIIPYARLYGADESSVYFQHIASGEAMIVDGVETLVLAQGTRPDDSLFNALEAGGWEVIAVGDCLAARTAEEAVLEGLRAGWAI